MKELPIDIIAEMKIRFDSDFDLAKSILMQYIAENECLESERVIRCVIFLADDGIESLKSYLDAAIGDPRDVMWWAEYEKPEKATDNSRRIWDFDNPFKERDI